MEQKYLDKDGNKLKRGFYLQGDDPCYFTGDFSKDGSPIFRESDATKKEHTIMFSKYVCKELRAMEMNEVENKIEQLRKKLNWYEGNLYSHWSW